MIKKQIVANTKPHKAVKKYIRVFNKMPEFDLGISATLYLSIAKQVSKFNSALNDLRLLMREFQKLEVTDGFDTPPLFFDLVSKQKYSDYTKTSPSWPRWPQAAIAGSG